jgi:hypothetical protein
MSPWKEIELDNFIYNSTQLDLLNILYPNIKEGKQNSPIREDNNPSFIASFYPNGNVYFHDMRFGKIGGLYEFISQIENISEKEVKAFITKKLNGVVLPNTYKKRFKAHIKQDFYLGVSRVPWNKINSLYWLKYGLSNNVLDYFGVSPIKTIFFNEGIRNVDQNCSYVYKEIKDEKVFLKTYCPTLEKGKWWSNAKYNDGVWHGWTKMRETGDLLIIDKSLKDTMVAFNTFPQYDSVSQFGEMVIPKPHIIQELKNRFKTILILADNDFDKSSNWGILQGKKLSEAFKIPYIFIPDKYQSKDRSDLWINYGEESLKIINGLI